MRRARDWPATRDKPRWLSTADLQAIVRVAARATNTDMLDDFTANNSESLQILLREFDTEVLPLPDDVMDALYESSQVAIQALVDSDPMAKKSGGQPPTTGAAVHRKVRGVNYDKYRCKCRGCLSLMEGPQDTLENIRQVEQMTRDFVSFGKNVQNC